MKKATAFITVIGLALATTLAAADDSSWRPHPGTKGTVTAYEADNYTVIDAKWCPRDRYGAHDYMACGNLLRSQIKTLMCNRGPGVHAWYYQVSDGPHLASTAYCH